MDVYVVGKETTIILG